MIETPFKLGWIPDLPDHRDHPFGNRPISSVNAPPASLPASIPLLPFAPGATVQGRLGSCTVNAVGNAVRYARVAQKKLNAFQPSRLFDYYNARAERGWEGFDSGSYIRDAIKVTNKFGTLPEDRYPYDISKFAEKPPPWVYAEALAAQSIAYYRLGWEADTPEKLLAEMKTCLAEGFPFVFGFGVYSNFPRTTSTGDMPMPGKTDKLLGGHAVLAVGYDDGSARFTFTNSWGYGWGRGGRGTIPYEYISNRGLADDFWTVRSVE